VSARVVAKALVLLGVAAGLACSSLAAPPPPTLHYAIVCGFADAGDECSCERKLVAVTPTPTTCDEATLPLTRCCAEPGYPLVGACNCQTFNGQHCWSYTEANKKQCQCSTLPPSVDGGTVSAPLDACPNPVGMTCCNFNDVLCTCTPGPLDCTPGTKVANCVAKTTCLNGGAVVPSCADADGG